MKCLNAFWDSRSEGSLASLGIKDRQQECAQHLGGQGSWSVQSDTTFLPHETLTKLLALLLQHFEMSLEDDALVRPSLMGPSHCKLAPIVFILLQPSTTGFRRKPASCLMMCIQKTEIWVSRKKKEKNLFLHTMLLLYILHSLHKI